MIFLIYYFLGLANLEFARRGILALCRNQIKELTIYATCLLFFCGTAAIIAPAAYQEIHYALNYWFNN